MKYLLIILLLVSCKVSKDNKAVTRVLSDQNLSDKVYSTLVKQHPISLDTVFKVIPGKPIVSYDTIEKPIFYSDTIIDLQPGKIKTVTQVITKYIHSIDTLVKIDPTCVRNLASINEDNIILRAQIQTQKDLGAKYIKQRNRFAGAACLIGLFCLFFMVLLIKRK